MAIYHFHVKIIGRKSGSSAVASAAYRSASRLRDDRLERSHDFSAKRGVVHSEVMLPENAPEVWSDRERLWNDVEVAEVRKDAQLAREVEFALPREMTQAQGIELARDFVQSEFVDQGMIADLNVHWDVGKDGMPKPHAHVMLTMRAVDEHGLANILIEALYHESSERVSSFKLKNVKEIIKLHTGNGKHKYPELRALVVNDNGEVSSQKLASLFRKCANDWWNNTWQIKAIGQDPHDKSPLYCLENENGDKRGIREVM